MRRLGRRYTSTWCAGCESWVSDRSWNQDTYLCAPCTAAALLLIRRWAGGKVLTAYPLSTALRRERVEV